jgi:hypothetical protein
MNYASACFIGFTLIAVLWYIVNARKHYSGPAITPMSKSADGVIRVAERYDASEELQSDDSPGPVDMPKPMRA